LVDQPGIKKLKQQTFENNSNRFRTNLDPYVGVLRLPVETVMKADTKLTVVMCCHFFITGTQRHLTAISGGGRRRRCFVD
jgi:hypothetical protein